jgi:phage shock protein E
MLEKKTMKNDFETASFVAIRTPEEFAQGHCPSAVNVPLNEVVARRDEVKALNQPVVPDHRSGNQSGMAALLLQQHGLAEVYIGGGLDDLPGK